jgi:hypothetical protein
MSYAVISQDIPDHAGTPWAEVVDLPIPQGSQVTGSGVLLLSTDVGGDVDQGDDSAIATAQAKLSWTTGPHPSDMTLWRIVCSQDAGGSQDYMIRAWAMVTDAVETIDARVFAAVSG